MLTLSDISVNKELDRDAMSEVRGGTIAAPRVPGSIFEFIYTDYDYKEKWNLQNSNTMQTNNMIQDGSTHQNAVGKGNLNVAGGSYLFGLQVNASETVNG